MKVTVVVEIGTGSGERRVIEQIETTEDFRGDYRNAVGECASRVELSTFGPQFTKPGDPPGPTGLFDEQLKMRGQQ